MSSHAVSRITFAVAGLLLCASVASAQATRTWVSGVGDDANPCSRTAPCKTFAGAISKTAAGGEINALDPGGFGAVTITKSITISGGAEQSAILVAGTNGILINAAGVKVQLRHLNLNGIANGGVSPGLVGIRFLQGHSLIVEDVTLNGFQTGIQVEAGDVTVRRSQIVYNTDFGAHAMAGTLTLEDNLIANNRVAVQATTPGTVRVSGNGLYNNLAGFGCGGGTIASAGNNRKAGNSGAGVPVCSPTVAVTLQ